MTRSTVRPERQMKTATKILLAQYYSFISLQQKNANVNTSRQNFLPDDKFFLNFKPQNAAVTRLICRSQRFFADRAGQARAPAADAIRGGRIKF